MLNNEIFELCKGLTKVTMAEGQGGPFGAAIIDPNGEILCVASNTVLGSKDPTAHAEINAIRKACKMLDTHDLTGYTIYATGYPCPMCMGAIIWANIKHVVYACPASDCAEIGFRDDFMYDFIRDGCANKEILDVEFGGATSRLTCKMMYFIYANDHKEIY